MLETIRSFACGSTSRLSEGAKLLAGAAPERPSHPRPVPALAALHGEAVVGVLRDPMMALATVAFEVYVNSHTAQVLTLMQELWWRTPRAMSWPSSTDNVPATVTAISA